MKILILGQDGHGKSYAAELFKEYHNISFRDSTIFILGKAVWPELKDFYSTKKECFNDRRSKRNLWKAILNHYNFDDEARIYREALMASDMYVGMRCNKAYEASRHLFDKVYYIDACERTGVSSGSLTIPFNPEEMELLPNNGTKDDLKKLIQGVKLL